MSDPLVRLIREADEAAGAIRPPPVGLADRVRRKAAGRARTRASLAGFSILVLIVLGVTWPWGASRDASTVASRSEGPVPVAIEPKARDPAELRAEIDRLASEIRTREAVVEALVAYEENRNRLASLRRELDRPDPLAELDAQIVSVADLALQSAERRCGSGKAVTACAAAYKRIVDLFPRTPAAGTAKQRLRELDDPSGGVS
jgi:hypothetical protein